MRVDPGLNGWLVIDKPPGLSSSRVVQMIRRITGRKVGHAGTLDPLATGVLPVAVGEATKTTAYAMAGQKRYRFRIRWGVAPSHRRSRGRNCRRKPVAAVPQGNRDGAAPFYRHDSASAAGLFARSRSTAAAPTRSPARDAPPRWRRGRWKSPKSGSSACPTPTMRTARRWSGKGTYIRALARDIGEALGTLSHVAELRRLVGRAFHRKPSNPAGFHCRAWSIFPKIWASASARIGAGRHPGGDFVGSGKSRPTA